MNHYEIFATLNDSTLFNALLTVILYSPLVLFLVCIVVGGIKEVCQQRQAYRDRINSIPTMHWNELRRLAKDYNIKVSRGTNKYMLQNLLIYELA